MTAYEFGRSLTKTALDPVSQLTINRMKQVVSSRMAGTAAPAARKLLTLPARTTGNAAPTVAATGAGGGAKAIMHAPPGGTGGSFGSPKNMSTQAVAAPAVKPPVAAPVTAPAAPAPAAAPAVNPAPVVPPAAANAAQAGQVGQAAGGRIQMSMATPEFKKQIAPHMAQIRGQAGPEKGVHKIDLSGKTPDTGGKVTTMYPPQVQEAIRTEAKRQAAVRASPNGDAYDNMAKAVKPTPGQVGAGANADAYDNMAKAVAKSPVQAGAEAINKDRSSWGEQWKDIKGYLPYAGIGAAGVGAGALGMSMATPKN